MTALPEERLELFIVEEAVRRDVLQLKKYSTVCIRANETAVTPEHGF